MAVSVPRVRDRRDRSVGHLPDTPGFRRRHLLLAGLLAAHLPGLAVLAVVTGGAAHDVLVEAAVVLVAVTAGAFLEVSARLRTLALTAGLLWCSVVVGLLTAGVVAGAPHAALVGLLAAPNLGACWRTSPRATAHDGIGPQGAGASDRDHEPDGQRLVEVQEVYTGVWSAHRLVRPRTRLLRLPDQAPDGPSRSVEEVAAADGAPSAAPPAASADEQPAATGADEVGDEAAPETGTAAAAEASRRDPDLTREVLEALHLSTVEETSALDGREHATTGPRG